MWIIPLFRASFVRYAKGMGEFEEEAGLYDGGATDDGFGEEEDLAEIHGGHVNPLEPGVDEVLNRFEE